jgi:hypothetical protein
VFPWRPAWASEEGDSAASLETVLGCSLEDDFSIDSGRQVSGLNPDSARKTTADAPDTEGSVKRQAAS